jgi:16S rRNA (guanine(966)-N(2))-methyltransferase RsmD
MSSQRHSKNIKCFEVPILGGAHKGKKILVPDISTTRSSKSILRESLFNTLQFDIVGMNFVEVFAGSGSVGLEAISRGAHEVYFMEQNREVYEVLQSNIRSIGGNGAHSLRGDSFKLFAEVLGQLDRKKIPTYFYFDPPFSIRSGMEDIYDKTMDLISTIPIDLARMVIVEHFSRLDMPESIGDLKLHKKKKFGKSTLSYYAT